MTMELPGPVLVELPRAKAHIYGRTCLTLRQLSILFYLPIPGANDIQLFTNPVRDFHLLYRGWPRERACIQYIYILYILCIY